jgi:UDP-glucuronate 4-epimerase
MKAILVTGGAGFIGSHVVDRLLAAGERVVCLDSLDTLLYDASIKRANLQEAFRSDRFHWVEGDIRDAATLETLFGRYRFDSLFHAAALAGVRPSIEKPLLYQDVNVRGTLLLLDYACRHKVKNFVFASSSSVYGADTKVPFSEEDTAGRPISPYAATKRAGELLCYTYHHLYGLPVTGLRFFTVYGPRQRPEMAIHRFTRLIEEGREVPVYGDGTARRDFTYIDDAVAAVVAAIERRLPYEILNIGEAETVSLMELVSLIEGALGRKATVKHYPVQPGDVPITSADIGRANRLLGYDPKTPLKAGLAKFVEWYRGQNKSTQLAKQARGGDASPL